MVWEMVFSSLEKAFGVGTSPAGVVLSWIFNEGAAAFGSCIWADKKNRVCQLKCHSGTVRLRNIDRVFHWLLGATFHPYTSPSYFILVLIPTYVCTHSSHSSYLIFASSRATKSHLDIRFCHFRCAELAPSTHHALDPLSTRLASFLGNDTVITPTKSLVQLERISCQFRPTCSVGELRLDPEHTLRSTLLVLQKAVHEFETTVPIVLVS